SFHKDFYKPIPNSKNGPILGGKVNDFCQIYKDDFLEIIDKPGLDSDDKLLRFSCIILLSEYDHLRMELLSLVKGNPLAVFRIYNLRRKFRASKDALLVCEKHKQRVEWQIGRIYRLRNSIVHSGSSLPYIANLVINMDTYYRTLISSIMSEMLEHRTSVTLDRLFSDVFMRRSENEAILSKHENQGVSYVVSLLKL
ncbi:MAG: hypothetical protein QGH69_06190, partial [Alphaproteobacteria bacterium]|nr:hypothetical protein [Alphaproteobacteria bacterium]